jgi:hypothetical protein
MEAVRGLGRDVTLSAFAATFIPNIAVLILSVAITRLSAQQDNEVTPA